MDLNTTIDIGKNMTDLLEKLAMKIGTTADKIFPWYINQQFIDGITFIIVMLILIMVSFSILYVSNKKANYKGPGKYEVAAICSLIFGVFAVVIFSLEINTALSKIFNPEYYAFKTLTRDLSHLLGK